MSKSKVSSWIFIVGFIGTGFLIWMIGHVYVDRLIDADGELTQPLNLWYWIILAGLLAICIGVAIAAAKGFNWLWNHRRHR